ncbi:uncharacterized protein [Periplaneta americana]|uniref:uncharacterized protein isoform X4 n=1 Tax=Periplaneta americana TaxID=6978 RepID=UPI0037E8BB0C
MEFRTVIAVSFILWVQLHALPVEKDNIGSKQTDDSIEQRDSIPVLSRAFAGQFLKSDKHKNGIAVVYFNSSIIADINTLEEWLSGHGESRIVSGGIGYDYAVFNYSVPAGVGLNVITQIICEEDLENLNVDSESHWELPKEFAKNSKGEIGDEAYFVSYAEYRSRSKSRNDIYAFSVDRTIKECYGDSVWYNGNGSRIVSGGISEEYLGVTLGVPAGVSGYNFYRCTFVSDSNFVEEKDFPKSKQVRSLPSFLPKERTLLYQSYGTILKNTAGDITQGFGNMTILVHEGGVDWKNGTGLMYVSEGGVGFNFVQYGIVKSTQSYGTYQYNMVLYDQEQTMK